jgi:hypothetical protein
LLKLAVAGHVTFVALRGVSYGAGGIDPPNLGSSVSAIHREYTSGPTAPTPTPIVVTSGIQSTMMPRGCCARRGGPGSPVGIDTPNRVGHAGGANDAISSNDEVLKVIKAVLSGTNGRTVFGRSGGSAKSAYSGEAGVRSLLSSTIGVKISCCKIGCQVISRGKVRPDPAPPPMAPHRIRR